MGFLQLCLFSYTGYVDQVQSAIPPNWPSQSSSAQNWHSRDALAKSSTRLNWTTSQSAVRFWASDSNYTTTRGQIYNFQGQIFLRSPNVSGRPLLCPSYFSFNSKKRWLAYSFYFVLLNVYFLFHAFTFWPIVNEIKYGWNCFWKEMCQIKTSWNNKYDSYNLTAHLLPMLLMFGI